MGAATRKKLPFDISPMPYYQNIVRHRTILDLEVHMKHKEEKFEQLQRFYALLLLRSERKLYAEKYFADVVYSKTDCQYDSEGVLGKWLYRIVDRYCICYIVYPNHCIRNCITAWRNRTDSLYPKLRKLQFCNDCYAWWFHHKHHP